MEYGFLSVLPPLIAIIFAIVTRQVIVSLLMGIFLGWLLITDWNLFAGIMSTIDAIVGVFQDAGNTKTILFSCLIGVLILFIQKSGGVAGFIQFLQSIMSKQQEKNNHLLVQVLAWLTGLLLFVESNISVLTVGTLFRPVFDDLKISREKLAYIADSSSAPSCILIPFNAWGAFIMSLLVAQGYSNSFQILAKSILYNFYPIIALLLVLVVIFSKKHIGAMQHAETRTNQEGKVLNDNAQPMIADELTSVSIKEGLTPRMINMIIPLVIMVLMMPVMLAITGWEASSTASESHVQQIFNALGQGSGSTAVLVSVLTAIFAGIILYSIQKLFSLQEIMQMTTRGMSEMLPLALILVLAFAISNLCREHLHTGEYIASISQDFFSPNLIPFLVFITSAFIAFSTGTSWGTFGIMIAIAIPLAQQMGAHEVMTIAAVLGGGVFGDHCSPISDTTIVSSMAAATDHIDHVRTQLPYALIGGALAALLYLILGFVL